MADNKLNLVRVHDHEGSHLVWQTNTEARAHRWQRFTQWCSDTSLAGVATIATVWKWARRPVQPPVCKLTEPGHSGKSSTYVRMRIDAQV